MLIFDTIQEPNCMECHSSRSPPPSFWSQLYPSVTMPQPWALSCYFSVIPGRFTALWFPMDFQFSLLVVQALQVSVQALEGSLWTSSLLRRNVEIMCGLLVFVWVIWATVVMSTRKKGEVNHSVHSLSLEKGRYCILYDQTTQECSLPLALFPEHFPFWSAGILWRQNQFVVKWLNTMLMHIQICVLCVYTHAYIHRVVLYSTYITLKK